MQVRHQHSSSSSFFVFPHLKKLSSAFITGEYFVRGENELNENIQIMPTFIILHPNDALQRSSGSSDVFKASIGAGDGRVLIFFLLGHSLPRSRFKKINMIKLSPERIMIFQFQARLIAQHVETWSFAKFLHKFHLYSD
ncbi:hypothetical protein T07_9609 [Trichinella nelsoni]|uniref:Uncharacterized protein n=1 Tax=Trichinella nelsoni TaxID=6336 RepID=A0A0V0SEL2_9BILA|nr:hypothetical protein T07_9609 [Trichinella nelsoni]